MRVVVVHGSLGWHKPCLFLLRSLLSELGWSIVVVCGRLFGMGRSGSRATVVMIARLMAAYNEFRVVGSRRWMMTMALVVGLTDALFSSLYRVRGVFTTSQ